MKISEEIEAKINEVESFENCQLSPLWNDGYISGLRKAKKIVVAHESKYGWQPIATAPVPVNGLRRWCSDWFLVRDTPIAHPYPAYFTEIGGEREWADSGGDEYSIVHPAEWYRIDEEETK